ncbi:MULTISPECIES: hypothetical protein [unclassified Massilia]|uniref:hypothetical protein n=1 Tax=unclassified Massilia TaxID=2609279 RepID=UPI001601543C|nr:MULTISPECIES: hypothetical protein [unclassified Massilia]
MFGSSVLELAIGLTFCYGTVALIVTTVQEALAAAFRLRANTLLAGIKSMLNDPRFEALAQAVYAHPLVNPHSDGSTVAEPALAARPSYIEPAHFAIALIDSIQQVPGNFARLGADIDAVSDPQVRRALHALHARAGGDLERFQRLVAGWFDNAMQRVSGSYKRRQLLISFLVSLLLAILFNIDSIALFRTLWQQPQLAAHIGAVPSALDAQTLRQLWALPIGWQSFPPVLNAAFALQVAGWIVTAATTLFGAPFWFDLLQRAVQLRGTGARPDDSARVELVPSFAPAPAGAQVGSVALEVRGAPALPPAVQ